MKAGTKYSLILFLAILLGCKSEIEQYQIDLYICEATNEKFLNKTQIEILLPVKYLDGNISLPGGQIRNSKGSIIYTKPKTWLESMRGSITKNTSHAILNEKIKNHLEKLDLSPLSTGEGPNIDSINEQIKKHDATLILNAKCTETLINGIPCFTMAEDLKSYIIDSLILKKQANKFLVLYGFQTHETEEDGIGILQEGAITDEQGLTVDVPRKNEDFDKELMNRLHSDLLDLGLNKMDPNERYKQVPIVYTTYFESKAFIKRVTPESRRTMEVYENEQVKDYLISLTNQIKLKDIKIIEIFKGSSGKLRGVTLAEIKE